MNRGFIKKAQSLSAKEIIMSMVNGLKNPTTDFIAMHTFGDIVGPTCFGCAATNAICLIGGIEKKELFEYQIYKSAKNLFPDKEEADFVSSFEEAIDYLRYGKIDFYNELAETIGISEIKNIPSICLPYLYDDFTNENLDKYVELANLQD